MEKIVRFWVARFHASIASLIATVGLLSLIVCLALLLCLGWLFKEVWEKEAFRFDETILISLHQWANPTLDWLMLTVTRLGNPPTVVGVVAGSFAWLWWRKKHVQMKVFAIACLGALILNQALKLSFAKTRPQLWKQLITETTFSFPSGHALGSLILYGFLAYLLATEFSRYSRLIYAITIAVISLIGFSRLYLGVHWPTDVLAGYAVGMLWLITCITMLRLQTRVN